MQITRRNLFAGAAVVGAGLTASKSIVSPARAAAPPAGKQNAGWYRYKVGDFEVTVVTDGTGTNPLSDAYIANAPKADVNAALAANFLPQDKLSHSYTPVVINTGSKLVAIDTGLGLGMFEQSKGAVGQYHSNLQAAGIDRNAVDVVIISHFHGDHINGLVGPENKPAFPNAEVMVPEIEAAFWADESNTSKLPEPARPQMGNVKRVMGIVGSKVPIKQARNSSLALPQSPPPAIRPVTHHTWSHLETAKSSCKRTSPPELRRCSCVIRSGNSVSILTSRRRSRRARKSTIWPRLRR